MPMPFLPVSLHSIRVVPDPTKASRTVSPSFEYLKIKFLATCGAQFPLYLEFKFVK